MRRFFLIVLLWAGVAAPSFAQTCVGGSGCVATLAYYSTLQAPYCQSYANGPISWGGKNWNQYSCTWPPQSGTTQWVPTTAGCPSGYQQSGNQCIVIPTGATQSQKDAAKAAARAKAAEQGFDEAARAAAETAANQVMDDWINAGKSEAESLQAATAAGSAAAIENIYSRYASENSAVSSTCSTSGPDSAACNAAISTYNSHMIAAGINPDSPPAMSLTNSAGNKVVYQRDPLNGDWSVYEELPGGFSEKYLGRTPTLNFSPTASNEPVFGSVASPGVVNTSTGEPVRDPTAPSREILESSAAGVTVLKASTSTVSYHSPTTGEVVGKVTKQPDGSFVTTGTVPEGAVNQAARALDGATSGGTSGGSSGAADVVNVSDPGATSYSPSTGLLDAPKNSFLSLFSGVSGTGLSHGWSWGFNSLNLTTPACAPWVITTAGKTISMDVCPVAEKIRDIGAFVFYFLTVIGLFNIMTGNREHS